MAKKNRSTNILGKIFFPNMLEQLSTRCGLQKETPSRASESLTAWAASGSSDAIIHSSFEPKPFFACRPLEVLPNLNPKPLFKHGL